MLIGSHCQFSAPDYFVGAIKEALGYNATALMIYTGAPQNTIRVPLDKLKITEGQKLLSESPIRDVIVHAPYILNLANPDKEKQLFSINFLAQELVRAEALGASCLVLHPGNYLADTKDNAIARLITNLNTVFKKTSQLKIKIALETMAGKGTEIGATFEEIATIINGVNEPQRLMVCLDTCHIVDGGYDLVNNYEEVINHFDETIGLNKLAVIHLNDSKFGLSSHKDRHANIGQGMIGLPTLLKVVGDKRFSHVAKILETPYIDNNPPYKEEIALLKGEI